jgi:hypothetical protein
MIWWKIISRKLLKARVPIATVNAVMLEIDTNGDDCVSVEEIIDGIKRYMI